MAVATMALMTGKLSCVARMGGLSRSTRPEHVMRSAVAGLATIPALTCVAMEPWRRELTGRIPHAVEFSAMIRSLKFAVLTIRSLPGRKLFPICRYNRIPQIRFWSCTSNIAQILSAFEFPAVRNLVFHLKFGSSCWQRVHSYFFLSLIIELSKGSTLYFLLLKVCLS